MIVDRARNIAEIVNHPLNRHRKVGSFFEYIRWNVGRRMLNNVEFVIDLVEDSRIAISNRENYATLVYTCRLYDFAEMLFLLHALRHDESFGDFGANIGVYSILAGLRTQNVIAVEPIPSTFKRLSQNLRLNNVRAKAVNRGLGTSEGYLRFTSRLGGLNHVVSGSEREVVERPVVRADSLANEHGILPSFLKIDVEGYEYSVLEGAAEILECTAKAIIIELNGSGIAYGFKDEDVDCLLRRYGFASYSYSPITRELVETATFQKESFNTLYVKTDAVDAIRNRLRKAPSVQIGARAF